MVSTILGILGFAFVLYLGVGLVLLLRDTVVSRRITRGESSRLRFPRPDGIEALTGVAPSPELVEFYRTAPFLEWKEFDLTDPSQPARTWTVTGFIPLTTRDIREALHLSPATNVIPLAWMMGKGAFLVTHTGAVVYRDPDVPSKDHVVAPNVQSLLTFTATRD